MTGRPRVSLEERFWRFVLKTDGCWLWTGRLVRHGYGQISLGGRHPKRAAAHRASWEIANGPVPDGLWVLHHCDNPPCVRPDHLFLGTAKDNSRDRDIKGRGKMPVGVGQPGELHPSARLTESQVLEIRRRYAEGSISQRRLADEYGIHQTHVSDIVIGRAWSHVPGPRAHGGVVKGTPSALGGMSVSP